MLEGVAKRVESEPLPSCSIPKDKNLRYKISIFIVSAFLLVMTFFVIYSQESDKIWITRVIQVEFGDSEDLRPYRGCYDIDSDLVYSRRYSYKMLNDNIEDVQIQFGYCEKNRQWVLFKNRFFNGTEFDNPCLAGENELAAFSSRTSSFDISTSFRDPWYSASNAPLDLVVVELKENTEDCRSLSGNGVCNKILNTGQFEFDGGDCCVATCNHTGCGKDGLKFASVFGTRISSGDGFPDCIDLDPSMKSLTIRLNSLSMRDQGSDLNLRFECDGSNVFSIPVDLSMENNVETVVVYKAGNCSFKMEELYYDKEFSWGEMSYTIFSENKNVLHEGYVSTNKTIEHFLICKWNSVCCVNLNWTQVFF